MSSDLTHMRPDLTKHQKKQQQKLKIQMEVQMEGTFGSGQLSCCQPS